MKPLRFYVIITPKSLRFLEFCLWSLQQREDLTIQLIGNGLCKKEKKALHQFAKQIDAPCFNLPGHQVLRHGKALDILLQDHNEEWFCFCDSDIVSLNHKANDLPPLTGFKAFSSCDAIFWGSEPVRGTLGRCNQWPDGSPMLTSFFCIYHTETLKKITNKYAVNFDSIAVRDIKSSVVLERLLKKKVRINQRLDTGKAITAALELEGVNYSHNTIESLVHIGGLSSWILNGDKNLLKEKYVLTDEDIHQIAEPDSWLYNPQTKVHIENEPFLLRRQQRLSAARYVSQLIAHYHGKTPKPELKVSEPTLVAKLESVSNVLNKYYTKGP